MFIAKVRNGCQAPLGAACRSIQTGNSDMPLLAELENRLVEPRGYKHGAPDGAIRPAQGPRMLGAGAEASSPRARNHRLSTLDHRHSGSLMVELLVAVALVIGVLLPLAYSFVSERRLTRSYYQRAVAMEIVDGEMEALLAGQWRAFPPGTHDYRVNAGAATNLPPGRFSLTVQADKVRLRWQPALKDHGGPVTREAVLK